jgi:hypothetical protein
VRGRTRGGEGGQGEAGAGGAAAQPLAAQTESCEGGAGSASGGAAWPRRTHPSPRVLTWRVGSAAVEHRPTRLPRILSLPAPPPLDPVPPPRPHAPPPQRRNDVIRTLPLFDTFRTALAAMASSVGGPAGLSALLSAHCRAGVPELAQHMLEGTLESYLAEQARIDAHVRASLLAAGGWAAADSGGSSDADGDDGAME